MKLFVLGQRDTVNGFKLAGVNGEIDTEISDIDARFNSLVNDKEYGVIFLSRRTADKLRAKVDEIKLNQPMPVIFEVEDDSSAAGGSKLLQFIKESVGIKI